MGTNSPHRTTAVLEDAVPGAPPPAPSPRVGHSRLWAAAATLITAAILVGCFLPRLRLPSPPGLAFDKVLHLGAFAALAFAWHRAGVRRRHAILIAAALALVTEGGQALFVRGRSGDLLDAAADLAGALLGLLLARLPWLLAPR